MKLTFFIGLLCLGYTVCLAQQQIPIEAATAKDRIHVPINHPSDRYLVLVEGRSSESEGEENIQREMLEATFDQPTIEHHVSDVQNVRYFVKVDPNCKSRCIIEEVAPPAGYQTTLAIDQDRNYRLKVGDRIDLDFNEPVDGQLEILNLQGKKLLTHEVNGSSSSLDHSLAAGIYLLLFKSADSNWSEKIIIN